MTGQEIKRQLKAVVSVQEMQQRISIPGSRLIIGDCVTVFEHIEKLGCHLAPALWVKTHLLE